MRIAVGVIAFEEEEYIEALLDNWYPYADDIIIAEGAWQTAARIFKQFVSRDNTIQIINDYPDPDKKINLVHLNEKNQIQQLDKCYQIALKKKPDWYVMSGADEFYHENDLKGIKQYLSELSEDAISLQIPMRLYWNDFIHYERQIARRFMKCAYAKKVGDLSRFSTKYGRKIQPMKVKHPIMYHPSYVREDTARFSKKKDFREKDGSSGAMSHYMEGGIIYRGTCTKKQWFPRLYKQDLEKLPQVMKDHKNFSKKWRKK